MNNILYLLLFIGIFVFFFTYKELYNNKVKIKKYNMNN